ncbi:hypothetical protein GCM10007301_38120 [Azorhizobium oxalatiphilum]|uniref:Helix-turn-helix domain-containing protein n=1 Tax=Azorhizobium oxalatiphilum TaxID=980631 RepID=A0A917FG61_9HYPH|nr:helix-turn-helix domain-containing protein [Azorhizobium oxalatiphilum]GGF74639.1 hypothetical protein GCM10007301_38120 [Azorhizobium oxalatiphilum]
MAQTENPGALSINDFCQWAGIGRTLAYRQIQAGRLSTKKVGRRTLITMEAARSWLDALTMDQVQTKPGAARPARTAGQESHP